MKLVIARASTSDAEVAVTFAYASSSPESGAPRREVGELQAMEVADTGPRAAPHSATRCHRCRS